MYSVIYAGSNQPFLGDNKEVVVFTDPKEGAEFIARHKAQHPRGAKLRLVKTTQSREKILAALRSGKLCEPIHFALSGAVTKNFLVPGHCAHHEDSFNTIRFFASKADYEEGRLSEIPTLEYFSWFVNPLLVGYSLYYFKNLLKMAGQELDIQLSYDAGAFVEAYSTDHLASCVSVGGMFGRRFSVYIKNSKHPMELAAAGDWAMIMIRNASKRLIGRGLAYPANKCFYNFYADQSDMRNNSALTNVLKFRMQKQLKLTQQHSKAAYYGAKQLAGPILKGTSPSGSRFDGDGLIYRVTAPLQPVHSLRLSNDEKFFINTPSGPWILDYTGAFTWRQEPSPGK